MLVKTLIIYLLVGPKESALKGIELLVEHDMEFRHKLIDLLTETQKRLQKEFDELKNDLLHESTEKDKEGSEVR